MSRRNYKPYIIGAIIAASLLSLWGIIHSVKSFIAATEAKAKERCDEIVEAMMSEGNEAFTSLRAENARRMAESKAIYEIEVHKTDSFKNELKKSKKYVPTSDRSSASVNRRIDSLMSRLDQIGED